jgi:hypothetical protein
VTPSTPASRGAGQLDSATPARRAQNARRGEVPVARASFFAPALLRVLTAESGMTRKFSLLQQLRQLSGVELTPVEPRREGRS